MRRWLPRSLQGRLLSLVIGLVLAVWAAAAALTWIDARHELDELLDAHLAQAAALLVAREAADIEEPIDVHAPTLHRYAPRVAFQIFDGGRLVLRSAQAPVEPMASAGGFQTVTVAGTRWRVFTTTGFDGDEQVHVGEQVSSRTSILFALMRSMLWPTLLALPLLAIAAWWAVRHSVNPLRSLSQRLLHRRPDELGPVELQDAPAEVTPLVEALNALFLRIGTLLESERRFTADAAHELRTPIAAIRAQAQVALAASDDATRRHALDATVQGCDRASRLVDQLLTLSRADAELPQAQTVELGELTRLVAADIAPHALAKHQSLALQVPAACSVNGDATLLAVLVRNLLDNAVRYSPASAQVQVAVEQRDGRVHLSVEDSGPGLDEAQRSRLGERFFRVPGIDQSGSGLGWSIVRRIAALHDAEVQVGPSARLTGLAVEVIFPAA
ncbi:MAG TPA: ATP-binding protein [Ideonella sp.]|uniref:ATP-binding protein n=1 Tax=Ideonella sp. TaxID=1929293 RepID=UPI002E34147B|nr:ATP-binding protein [Ideonella sp.]HEX5685104.1 ATP-binding protein [Ideonella sp.]